MINSCPSYGSAIRLTTSTSHGDDEAKVYRELCKIVEENIALYKEDGKPLPAATGAKKYSGKFILRTQHSRDQNVACGKAPFFKTDVRLLMGTVGWAREARPSFLIAWRTMGNAMPIPQVRDPIFFIGNKKYC